MPTSANDLSRALQSAPTFQSALSGQWFAPGMPHTAGFRSENLRAAARADGIEIPSGYAFNASKGQFYDANADHWYSDPRVLGPIAVGAASAGLGAFGGAGSAAGGAASAASGSAIPGAAVPTSIGMSALPAAIASQGASAAIPLGGLAAATAAPVAAGAGAEALTKLLSVKGIASLGPVIAALAARGGNPSATADTAALSRIQGITEQQMRRADPLHQAVTQLAYQRLPISARAGTTYDPLPLKG